MGFTKQYLDKWKQVPAGVKQFILRALIILVVWKILYLVFLSPTRVLDRPLSHAVASGACAMLNTYKHTSAYYSKSELSRVPTGDETSIQPLDNIYFNQRNLVGIEDGCNGLELFILYTGFIVCMPASWRRKILFIFGGVLLIHIVNIIRCAWVAYIIQYYPKYADFAHHYVFTFIVYGLIIVLWLLFSRKITPKHAKA